MKTINDFCIHILRSPNLEDKLIPPPSNLTDTLENLEVPERPERESKIQFSDAKSKIPRLEHLNQENNIAITLHHFANHELMAIELFAYALLKFQFLPLENKKDMLKTIVDEQRHLKLYLNRMKELGMELGDRPLNYIFWKYTPKMSTPEKFASVMSISFEGANLDYAILYQKTFSYFEDDKSSKIMNIIYKDELVHVKRGYSIFLNSKPNGMSDWEYYNTLIEYPFTPRRAKGYLYLPYTREKVGLEKEFIEKLGEYKDEFSVRKPEVIPKKILERIL